MFNARSHNPPANLQPADREDSDLAILDQRAVLVRGKWDMAVIEENTTRAALLAVFGSQE